MSIELVRKPAASTNGGEFDGQTVYVTTAALGNKITFGPGPTGTRAGFTVNNAVNSVSMALMAANTLNLLSYAGADLTFVNSTYADTIDTNSFGNSGTITSRLTTAGAWTWGASGTTPTHLMRGILSMNASAGGVAVPTGGAYSAGDRIYLYDNGANSHYGFGISSGRMWLNANQTGGGIDFYVNGASLAATIAQDSSFTCAGTIAGQNSLMRLTGSAGAVVSSIEKTGDGTAELILGNNVGAGGTDKWWRMGATASASVGFDISTVTDNSGSSPVNIITLARTGNMKLNTSTQAALAASETLSIACSLNGGVYFGGILFNPRASTQAAGDFYWRFNDTTQNRGAITATNTTTIAYNTTSDARLKDNIVDFPNGYEMVKALQPRQFTWRQNDMTDLGFIAQELMEVYPGAVSGDPESEDVLQHPMGVDYGKVTPLLAAGLKELMNRFEALQADFQTYVVTHP